MLSVINWVNKTSFEGPGFVHIMTHLFYKVDKRHMGRDHASREKKLSMVNFFDFCADKYIYKRIPKDENPPMKGF